MHSLIGLVPLPDELDRGYLGRVMRINGFNSEKQARERLASLFGMTYLTDKELSFLELLAALVEQSTEQFALAHSTLPLRRAITSYFPDLAHGSTQRRTILCQSGMSATQTGAYLCTHCISEDVGFHGIAYWRREHQIPGQLWCSKHSTPLHFRTEAVAFVEPPASLIQAAEIVPTDWVQEAKQNVYVQRFLDIASGLLVHSHPIDAKFVSLALRQQAVAKGLQTNPRGIRKPLLSDLIVDQFPKRWLRTVFQTLLQKKRGEIQHQVDGVLYLRNAASSVVVYILACAVLYENPEGALNALFNARRDFGQRPARTVLTKSGVGRTALMEAYVKCQGKVTQMARHLEVPVHQVASLLTTHGLPSMSNRASRNVDMLAACHMFFVERKSMAESAVTYGISVNDLEDAIRTSGPTLTAALLSFKSGPVDRKAHRARAKGETPKNLLPRWDSLSVSLEDAECENSI